MRITRLNQRSDDYHRHTIIAKNKPRRIKRHVKENSQVSYSSAIDELNSITKFSYLNTSRNENTINLFKSQINQFISNYGIDLRYFRKYNTFFKKGDENKSNLIYGEDTTAEYYASGMIRSFVNIENMAWNFNQIGLENVEQINIMLSIDNFSQIFAKNISKIESDVFNVEISGNTIFNEGVGKIMSDHFDADVFVNFDDNLIVNHSNIKIVPKQINNSLYVSNKYGDPDYSLTGDLTGRLKRDDCFSNIVSGTITGELAYHNFENIEDSESWKLAPQIGDYFKFETNTGIDEEWEITQVFDRNLVNSNGINPLLGKYIYQCSAVKRQSSYEDIDPNLSNDDLYIPGQDLDEIFHPKKKKNDYPSQYRTSKNKNVYNNDTNKIAKDVFDYEDQSDETYGGYQNQPNSK